ATDHLRTRKREVTDLHLDLEVFGHREGRRDQDQSAPCTTKLAGDITQATHDIPLAVEGMQVAEDIDRPLVLGARPKIADLLERLLECATGGACALIRRGLALRIELNQPAGHGPDLELSL